MQFDDVKHNYQETIEESISFIGQSHDFFTEVKANYISEVIEKYLPGNPSPHILDAGCGHGLIHPYLLMKGYRITGVDVASEVISLAAETHPKVDYHQYDGKDLPFEENSFDVCIAICVMHHIEEAGWLSFLNNLRKKLRPGGLTLVFEHNPYHPLTRYVVAHNEIDADAVLLSGHTLKKLFQNARYRQVWKKNILFTPFSNQTIRCLESRFGWFPFGAQYFVVGKKE